MANFRVYPGLHVRLLEDAKPQNGAGETLVKGRIVQVIAFSKVMFGSPSITFVGVFGLYALGSLKLEPIISKEEL